LFTVNDVHGSAKLAVVSTDGVRRPLLRKANVVDGALQLLDEVGLDGLTMRKLGAALGVQAGALYRHYPSKAALLDAMAEKLVEGVADPPPEGDWDAQLTTLAHRFRTALLAHRDGARLFAGTFVSAPNTNAVGGLAVAALTRAGLPPDRAGWITYAGMYYVLGHTIEEQAQLALEADDEDWQARQAASPPADPIFAEALHSVTVTDPAERFTYGFELFVDGVRRRLDDGGR
jgi:TetR/AcrR family tetracycline transcriptional repressor